MSETSGLTYRPQLDGIRAVAVLLVFVFHSSPALLPGGFIGVDVFFVLSGYLITRVILQRRDGGNFTFADFYARRSRRLLPAMFVVVSAVALREAIWGSLIDAATRAREIVSTLLYIANWNLIVQADDYFAGEGSPSPLRHAWSLAVEEQFYILFPLLLVAAVAIGGRKRWIPPLTLLVLTAASASLMAVLYEPTHLARVYYGTDTRASQLLIGAIAGYLFHWRALTSGTISRSARAVVEWIPSVALGLLFTIAAFVSGASSAYYYGGAIVVAIAAIAMISALELAPSSRVGRFLAWAPVVFIGRISYGFYLWHWPIILWIEAPGGASAWELVAINFVRLLLTILVASVSFLLVEQPIRQRRWGLRSMAPRASVAMGIGLSVLLAFVLGSAVSPEPTPQSAGLTVRMPSFETGIVDRSSEADAGSTDGSAPADRGEVVAGLEAPDSTIEPALTGDEIASYAVSDRSVFPCAENPMPCVKYEPDQDPATPTIALIGDSTAQAYHLAIEKIATEIGVRYVHAAVGGCPISHRLLATGENGELHKKSNHLCHEALPSIYRELERRWNPELYIATSWNEMNRHVDAGLIVESGTPDHLLDVEEGLRDVLDELGADSTVAFIHVPPTGRSVDCLGEGPPDGPSCTRAVNPDRREVKYNAIFDRLAVEYSSVVSITLDDVICPDALCPLMIDGVVVRYDGRHLTGTASRALSAIIAERLEAEGVHLSELNGPAG